jgi:thymidine kinase
MPAFVDSVEVRGVYCRFCAKPIRLSASFIKRERAIERNEQASILELSSRVFAARCRSCHEEAIYTLSQVLDFPDNEP